MPTPTIPVLDLSLASSPSTKPLILASIRSALFDTGFLYLTNHGIPPSVISALTSRVPKLFSLDPQSKAALSKRNSPHFIGYSGFAEEVTQGRKDLREQFDFATELPVIWRDGGDTTERDLTKLYWRLRGPNQWPDATGNGLEGFREAVETYMGAVEELSLRFVHLVEEALGIPVGRYLIIHNILH